MLQLPFLQTLLERSLHRAVPSGSTVLLTLCALWFPGLGLGWGGVGRLGHLGADLLGLASGCPSLGCPGELPLAQWQWQQAPARVEAEVQPQQPSNAPGPRSGNHHLWVP